MTYEEIRQADENDRLDWLHAREIEVRAFADELCPVCDGEGYTDGVTVRHPCYNCNPDFRLDRATDRLVEIGAETAVHTPLPWEAVEINHDLRRWQIVHFDEQRSAHYVTDIAPTYGTGTDEHEANANLIVKAVNGYAALQERLEAAENALMWTRRLADDRYDIMRALKARHQRIGRLAIIRGRCVFCAHPEDPADGTHTATCPVIDPDSDPCPYVHESGDRCVLQFEHGGIHDLGY